MTPRFWLLEPPPRQRLAKESPAAQYETIVCPADKGHQRGGRRIGNLSLILDPLGVKDFTWTWLSDILVPRRILDVFEKHRVTGFEAAPADTSYPPTVKARPPELFELVVTGWGGWAAPAAGVELVESCPACGTSIMSLPSQVA
jgi:hypothetical protein